MNLPFTNEQLYPRKSVTHRVGNVYDICGHGWHLLTQVEISHVVLVGLNNLSNRWDNPKKVKDAYFITENEFSHMIEIGVDGNDSVDVRYVGKIEDFIPNY